MASAASFRIRLWLRRAGWLAVLWLASVASLAVVALALRLLMHAAGLR
jgi:hypothetical protein